MFLLESFQFAKHASTSRLRRIAEGDFTLYKPRLDRDHQKHEYHDKCPVTKGQGVPKRTTPRLLIFLQLVGNPVPGALVQNT